MSRVTTLERRLQLRTAKFRKLEQAYNRLATSRAGPAPSASAQQVLEEIEGIKERVAALEKLFKHYAGHQPT